MMIMPFTIVIIISSTTIPDSSTIRVPTEDSDSKPLRHPDGNAISGPEALKVRAETRNPEVEIRETRSRSGLRSPEQA